MSDMERLTVLRDFERSTALTLIKLAEDFIMASELRACNLDSLMNKLDITCQRIDSEYVNVRQEASDKPLEPRNRQNIYADSDNDGTPF